MEINFKEMFRFKPKEVRFIVSLPPFDPDHPDGDMRYLETNSIGEPFTTAEAAKTYAQEYGVTGEIKTIRVNL